MDAERKRTLERRSNLFVGSAMCFSGISLLNPEHEHGEPKAKWFKEALGFSRENMGQLAKQIVFDRNQAIATKATEYGQKYEQIIRISGANGRVIDVNFVWIVNNRNEFASLVTAIPTKK